MKRNWKNTYILKFPASQGHFFDELERKLQTAWYQDRTGYLNQNSKTLVEICNWANQEITITSKKSLSEIFQMVALNSLVMCRIKTTHLYIKQ